MKIPRIAPFVLISICLAACEQKSDSVSSSPTTPSSEPATTAEASSSSSAPTFLRWTSEHAQSTPSPSKSVTNTRPAFRSEDANQRAEQYLKSYQAVLEDLNAQAPPPANSEVSMNNALGAVRKLGRDAQELANQQKQMRQALAPDERKRLLEYQRGLEQSRQDD
jgi:hypothetical protein